MIILYLQLHFVLVDVENTCTVSDTSEKNSISYGKQFINPTTDENIFQTIETNSLDTEATAIPSKPSKKRKQTPQEEATITSSHPSKPRRKKTFHEETTRVSARQRSKRSRLS